MDRRLTIGQLAETVGVPRKTIRHYEEVGVLPTPARSGAGYRLYTDLDVRRLELVRRARALDMGLAEARELVEWAGAGSCGDFQGRFQEVIHRKLEEVDQRIADLGHLKQDLQRLDANFAASQEGPAAGHTVLECSPETCTCLGQERGLGSVEGSEVMVETITAQELTADEQTQDCGCGCGGDAAKSDCGCGCGGVRCGTTQQELLLVDPTQVAEMRRKAAG